jgi:hypothetical protein
MPTTEDDATDSVVIVLEPRRRIELNELTDSFAGLSTFYDNNFGSDKSQKLIVSDLKTKCIYLELIPYSIILGGLITTAANAMTVADFVRRFCSALKAFADVPDNSHPGALSADVTMADAAALSEFIKPMVGEKSAELKISHARFERRDGERSTVVEYTFNQGQIDRAFKNIEAQSLASPMTLLEPPTFKASVRAEERENVFLSIEAASRKEGKTKGRTVDKAVVSSISEKALPIYFPDTLKYLKHQIITGEVNPFNTAFVVDVIVRFADGEPKEYILTRIREAIPYEAAEPRV